MSKRSPIYILDAETDPFKYERVPFPFAWDLYDGRDHYTAWGPNCTRDIMAILDRMEPGIVYAHNGGKFDCYWLWDYINTQGKLLIIHDRLVECEMPCALGHHLFRDSLKILPFKLGRYEKTEINYDKFESDVREYHKTEIISYLQDDTRYLYELVSEYFRTFGPSLTIGATAMRELKKFHEVGPRIDVGLDAMLRPYFFGGRVERRWRGSKSGYWKVYDVNSMYPHVMHAYTHPIGFPSHVGKRVTDDTFFLTVRGWNQGAFPSRRDGKVVFDDVYGEFNISIHEWNAANELGLFDCEEIIATVDYTTATKFDKYVDHYYAKRKHATDTGDKIHALFYKFLLNNSYGKFATNIANFKEYRITHGETPQSGCTQYGCKNPQHFHLTECGKGNDREIWSRPATDVEYMNVGTGASITGAARATLLRGIHSSRGFAYCDTDSIICKGLDGLEIDPSRLGAWKLDDEGNCLDIAGRKLYSLWQDSTPVKWASKGVNLTPAQIRTVATGGKVTFQNPAPTFHPTGKVEFISRDIVCT